VHVHIIAAVQLFNTAQTVWIIFPLVLQTKIIALMQSTEGDGKWGRRTCWYKYMEFLGFPSFCSTELATE